MQYQTQRRGKLRVGTAFGPRPTVGDTLVRIPRLVNATWGLLAGVATGLRLIDFAEGKSWQFKKRPDIAGHVSVKRD